MSYRHGSYRKMSRAVKKAMAPSHGPLTTAEVDRLLHWTDQPPLPKPPGWGKPKRHAA